MQCPKCNHEISDDYSYCPYCGVRIDKEKQETPPTFRRVNKVLGRVGYVLSIVGLALSWVWVVGASLSLFGILSSIFGTDSDEKARAHKTKVMGIIGLSLGILFTLAETVLFIIYLVMLLDKAGVVW